MSTRLLALVSLLFLAGCLDAVEPPTTTDATKDLGENVFPSTLTWSALADAPMQRNEVCATNVGPKFYVIGGYLNALETSAPGPAGSLPASVPQARMDVYDATTDTWSMAPDFPSTLDHCLAFEVGGVMYVVSHGQKFDPKVGAWKPIAPSPNGHTAGAGGVIDGKIYATGGGSTKVDVYDPVTDAWETVGDEMPTSRGHTSGAVIDGKLYVVGGDIGGHSRNTAANEEFDPATGNWTKRADLPVVRGSLKAFSYFGHVVVMGGQTGLTNVDSLSDVNAYDPVTDTWSVLPKMNHGRHGFDGGVWQDRLYVFLGSPQQGVDATAKADVLAP
jgi:N-acetylneuraminic acid mutarotase